MCHQVELSKRSRKKEAMCSNNFLNPKMLEEDEVIDEEPQQPQLHESLEFQDDRSVHAASLQDVRLDDSIRHHVAAF